MKLNPCSLPKARHNLLSCLASSFYVFGERKVVKFTKNIFNALQNSSKYSK